MNIKSIELYLYSAKVFSGHFTCQAGLEHSLMNTDEANHAHREQVLRPQWQEMNGLLEGRNLERVLTLN